MSIPWCSTQRSQGDRINLVQPRGVNRIFGASEVEYSIQISHRVLNLSNVSLSKAIISSIRMMSLTTETQEDRRGVVVVFQRRGISCLVADRKNRSRVSFCVGMEPGSMEAGLSLVWVWLVNRKGYCIWRKPGTKVVVWFCTPTIYGDSFHLCPRISNMKWG